jgi:hypothetical protein
MGELNIMPGPVTTRPTTGMLKAIPGIMPKTCDMIQKEILSGSTVARGYWNFR